MAANILSCFDDLIPIRGLCQDAVSTSGFYADDIDITKDFIDQIITRQFSGAKDFHERKMAFAIKQVVDETMGFMRGNFRVNTLIDNFRIGQHQDNLVMIPGDGKYKGINIDLLNCTSYLDLFISEIALQVNFTGDVDVFVYDLLQNKLLETITVPCVANEIIRVFPQLTINSSRQKLNILFCYDSTGINSNTTVLRGGSCSTCNGNGAINNSYENINAVKIPAASQKIKSNLTIINETGGLSIVHSLSCNHESWLCTFSKMLAMPILYRYGLEVMEFAKSVSVNDRVNTTLNINEEEIKARMDLYQRRYNESMSSAMNGIKTPSDKACFVCKEFVRTVPMAM
jgi:hypothetical protein